MAPLTSEEPRLGVHRERLSMSTMLCAHGQQGRTKDPDLASAATAQAQKLAGRQAGHVQLVRSSGRPLLGVGVGRVGQGGDSGNMKWQWRGRAGPGYALRLGLGQSWGLTWPPCSCLDPLGDVC